MEPDRVTRHYWRNSQQEDVELKVVKQSLLPRRLRWRLRIRQAIADARLWIVLGPEAYEQVKAFERQAAKELEDRLLFGERSPWAQDRGPDA